MWAWIQVWDPGAFFGIARGHEVLYLNRIMYLCSFYPFCTLFFLMWRVDELGLMNVFPTHTEAEEPSCPSKNIGFITAILLYPKTWTDPVITWYYLWIFERCSHQGIMAWPPTDSSMIQWSLQDTMSSEWRPVAIRTPKSGLNHRYTLISGFP